MKECICGGGTVRIVDEAIIPSRELFRIECLRHCGMMTSWCDSRTEAENEWELMLEEPNKELEP